MRTIHVLAGLLSGLILIAACSGSSAPQGEEVLTAKCVNCHSNLITCTNLGRDQAYWHKTVDRMVDKGMDISQDERAAVAAYLSRLEPGAKPVCQ